MMAKQSKSSIKRVNRGQRFVAAHPELLKGRFGKAVQKASFKGLLDTMIGVGRWSMEFVPGGDSTPAPNCPSESGPSKTWVTCPSREAATDLLHVMQAEELDNSFSKFANKIRLENDGRTIYTTA